jgi:hypothetical protein
MENEQWKQDADYITITTIYIYIYLAMCVYRLGLGGDGTGPKDYHLALGRWHKWIDDNNVLDC